MGAARSAALLSDRGRRAELPWESFRLQCPSACPLCGAFGLGPEGVGTGAQGQVSTETPGITVTWDYFPGTYHWPGAVLMLNAGDPWPLPSPPASALFHPAFPSSSPWVGWGRTG